MFEDENIDGCVGGACNNYFGVGCRLRPGWNLGGSVSFSSPRIPVPAEWEKPVQVSQTTPAQCLWNPGGLGFLRGSEVSITHANWLPQFHLADLFYDYLNFRQDVPEWGGTVAASVTYLNLGEFTITTEGGPTPVGTFKAFEVAGTVGYGTLITDNWGLGLNLRFINSALSPIGAGSEQGNGIAYDMSFDIATLYKVKDLTIPFTDIDLGDCLSIGANLSNLGPKSRTSMPPRPIHCQRHCASDSGSLPSKMSSTVSKSLLISAGFSFREAC